MTGLSQPLRAPTTCGDVPKALDGLAWLHEQTGETVGAGTTAELEACTSVWVHAPVGTVTTCQEVWIFSQFSNDRGRLYIMCHVSERGRREIIDLVYDSDFHVTLATTRDVFGDDPCSKFPIILFIGSVNFFE